MRESCRSRGISRSRLFLSAWVVLCGCAESVTTGPGDSCLISCFDGPITLPPMAEAYGQVQAWAAGDSTRLIPAAGAGVFRVDTLGERAGLGPNRLADTDSVGAYLFTMGCGADYEVFAESARASTKYRSDTVTVRAPRSCGGVPVPTLVIRGPA